MDDPTQHTLAVAAEVARERLRQVEDEGYDLHHDDDHGPGGLILYAQQYVTRAVLEGHGTPARRRVLQAAAILLAAVEAIDRQGKVSDHTGYCRLDAVHSGPCEWTGHEGDGEEGQSDLDTETCGRLLRAADGSTALACKHPEGHEGDCAHTIYDGCQFQHPLLDWERCTRSWQHDGDHVWGSDGRDAEPMAGERCPSGNPQEGRDELVCTRYRGHSGPHWECVRCTRPEQVAARHDEAIPGWAECAGHVLDAWT